jgi:hypothetical protein
MYVRFKLHIITSLKAQSIAGKDLYENIAGKDLYENIAPFLNDFSV